MRKIDIYYKWKGVFVYACSTNKAVSCKEAKNNFLKAYPNFPSNLVKTCFSKA